MKKRFFPIIFTSLLAVCLVTPTAIDVFARYAFDPAEMFNDPNYHVTPGSGEHVSTVEDSSWDSVVNSMKPLEVGETYTETWQGAANNDYSAMRLRPTHVSSAPDEEATAQYKFIKNKDDKTKIDGVRITTNQDTARGTAYLSFLGMRYIEGAVYDVSVNYQTLMSKAITVRLAFEYSFLDTQILPAQEGKTGSFNASFIGTTDVGYNNNSNAGLKLYISADSSAELSFLITSITLTRKADKPKLYSPSITGDLAVGSTLTFSRDKSHDIGHTDPRDDISTVHYKWFLSSDSAGTDRYVYLTESETFTIPLDAQNKYVGCIAQPISGWSGLSGAGEETTIIKGCAGTPEKNPAKFVLKEVGNKFTETFDSIANSPHLGFTADSGVSAYVTPDGAISNKSLRVKSETKESQGGIFSNVKFTGGKGYKVTFDLKFISKPTGFYWQFRDIDSLGYAGDVKSQVPILKYEVGNVYQVTIPCLQIMNTNNYKCQIFTTGECEYIIDNLSIELVQVGDEVNHLDVVGNACHEDFDGKNNLNRFDTFDWGGFYIAPGFDGNGYVIEGRETGGITLFFLDLKNKMSANTKYKVEFDYQLVSSKPTAFYVGFRGTADSSQINQLFSFGGKTIGQVYHLEHTYSLGNCDDYYMQLFNMAAEGFKMIIDNIVITNMGA